jgi:hypothetical protein
MLWGGLERESRALILGKTPVGSNHAERVLYNLLEFSTAYLQAIAAKEVDLRMAHVTARQDIRKVLTPEQQKQFKTMHGDRMREGGRREHGSRGD